MGTLRAGALHHLVDGFDRQRVRATLRTALAALVALVLANALGIDSPGWAAMTVFLVSQPTRGLLKARSFYRVAGTVVGAFVGAGMIVATGGSPLQLVLCLAVWLGLCCWLGNLARPLRAYGFMLSGYTAGIVALLSLNHHGSVAHLAFDRVEGVLLGALVAVLANGMLTPRSGTLARLDSIPVLVSDTLGWAARIIANGPTPALIAEEQARVRQMADIEFGLDEAAFGSLRKRRRMVQVRRVFSALLALATATRTVVGHLDRLEADAALRAWRDDLDRGLRAVQAAMNAGQAAADAIAPLRRLVATAPANSRLAVALAELVTALDAMLQYGALRDGAMRDGALRYVSVSDGSLHDGSLHDGSLHDGSLHDGSLQKASLHNASLQKSSLKTAVLQNARPQNVPQPEAPPLASRNDDSFTLHPHRDWVGARQAAFRTVLAILLVGGAWVATGWHYGPYMVLGTAVFLPLFSTMETPSALMRNVALGSIAGVSAAVLFTWLVLPYVHSEIALLAAVGAVLAVGALALAHRTTMPYALDYCMGFLLVSHPSWPMHTTLADTVGGAQAMTLGLTAAWLAFRYIVPVDPGQRLRVLVRHIVGDIEGMARSRTRLPEWKWRARMHQRILRLVARTNDAQSSQVVGDGMAALQLGHAVLRLQSLLRADDTPFAVRTAVRGAIHALARVSHHPNNAASALQEVARQIMAGAMSSGNTPMRDVGWVQDAGVVRGAVEVQVAASSRVAAGEHGAESLRVAAWEHGSESLRGAAGEHGAESLRVAAGGYGAESLRGAAWVQDAELLGDAAGHLMAHRTFFASAALATRDEAGLGNRARA
ncbi:FUSC family protein [Pigmentiphaga litoralis]|uniref:FUSC family protein n=1 Tax=Pigmentiphaga litoralis TaxID=516702 RepID=UPI003B436421